MDLPFDRKRGEPAKAWLMCLDFCRQPSGKRSLNLVAEAYNAKPEQVKKFFTEYNWERRSLAYDRYLLLLDENGSIDINKLALKNTRLIADNLNKNLTHYQNWIENSNTQQRLDSDPEAQFLSMRNLSLASNINKSMTETLYQQKDIELALKSNIDSLQRFFDEDE